MIPIVYTKWGLANRFDDRIELNENLNKYPKLKWKLLDHELKHTNEKFTAYDLKHDLSSQQDINYKELLVFMIKHPKALSQALPFYWSKRDKQIIYDLNLMIIYGVFFGIITVGTFVTLAVL